VTFGPPLLLLFAYPATPMSDVDPLLAGAAGAALVALSLSIAVALDAWRDLKYVRKAGIGDGRLRIAKTEFRFEAARVTVCALLLAVALSATVASAYRPPGIEPWARAAFLASFVVISLDGLSALRYRVWLRASYDPPSDHPRRDLP